MKSAVKNAVRTAAAAGAAGLAGYVFLIRPWQLRWGATDAEVARTFPGDDLVTAPWVNATRAIDIDAPPAAVWPWLVQMGYRRAGWYSYDRLDNDGIHVNRIIPELQHIAVGDKLLTDANAGFTVMAVEPNRALVLRIDDELGQISGTLVLDPLPGGRTRLILRLRARFAGDLRALLFFLMFDFGDFVMMRKMLLGIKQRAEASQSPAEPVAPAFATRASTL